MNRTERLYAIAEQLRRTGPLGVSAASLAAYLEVSTRTIKRDITALQQSGLPIWAQTGPNGGYFIADSATLPPVNFTASQAIAVSVALAVMPAGSPFGTDGEAAARKIRDALGPHATAQAAAVSARVWIDSPENAEPSTRPQVLRAVERSLLEHRTLVINYVNAAGNESRETVEPTMTAWTNACWYLVAYCQARDAMRWFRLDQIKRANLTTTHYAARAVADVGVPPSTARPVGAAS